MNPPRRLAPRLAILAGALLLSSCQASTDQTFPIVPLRLGFVVRPGTGQAGLPMVPVVSVAVLDSSGRTVSGAGVVVTLRLAPNQAGASLLGTTTREAEAGVATFPNVAIDRPGTALTIIATAPGLDSVTSTFNVSAARGSAMAIRSMQRNLVSDVLMDPPLEVVIVDAAGVMVGAATDTVSIRLTNPAGGRLSGTTTVAAVGGVARFTDLSIDKAASSGYLLEITAPGLATTAVPLTVAPGPPSAVQFRRGPGYSGIGDTLSPTPQVAVVDAAGNLTGFTGAVSLALAANARGATLSGVTSVNAQAGIASFPDVRVNTGASGLELVASMTGVTSATSAPFTVGLTQSLVPVRVSNGATFTSLASGAASHLCALKADQSAWCWGTNTSGQLGSGTLTYGPTPVAVAGGHRFSSLVVGAATTCGLDTDGATWCWGSMYSPAASEVKVTAPIRVNAGMVFTSILVGAHRLCGLTSAGEIHCGRPNGLDGSTADFQPVLPDGGPFVAMGMGPTRQCGVTAAGAIHCAGGYHTGDSYTFYPSQPESRSLSFRSVSTEYYHSCGVSTSATAYCWGYNSGGALVSSTGGQLGNGTTTSSFIPVAVSGGLAFSEVVVGYGASCGVTTAGEAWCWGSNGMGQLGNGTTDRSIVPVRVAGGLTFRSLNTVGLSACGLTTAGAVWCWGDNRTGAWGAGY